MTTTKAAAGAAQEAAGVAHESPPTGWSRDVVRHAGAGGDPGADLAAESPVSLEARMRGFATRARAASRALAGLDPATRRRALDAMERAIGAHEAEILAANARDLEAAAAAGLSPAMTDRLRLDVARLAKLSAAVAEIAALPDPVGEVVASYSRPNGLRVSRVRIPLGVLLMIYESRPNVTADAAALCFKAGNAVILRGGRESFHSNTAIASALRAALAEAGAPVDAVQLVDTTDRAGVDALLRLDELIDVVIPRGGEGLIRAVVEKSRIPVLKHYKGVCHVFVDESADPRMAADIVVNAKAQRPGVCNALETLLVHRDAAPAALPAIARRLLEAGVTLRGCARTRAILDPLLGPVVESATDDDWAAEYLDLILAVRVVDDLEAAIAHIHTWGSDHTEAIITGDDARAERFIAAVDSSTVLVNASTRFADGGELGLGAEIGISTSKLHAYGPMGARELTTTKIEVRGTGQVRR